MKPGAIAHSVSRGVFYLVLEKAVATVMSLLYSAIVWRWLGPTKWGTLVLAYAIIGMAMIATGNVETYLARFSAEFDARGQVRTLRRAFRLVVAMKSGLGVLVTVALLAALPLIDRQFHSSDAVRLVPILAVAIVFDGLAAIGQATLSGLQQFRWTAAIGAANHSARVLMVALLWGARQGLPAMVIGLATLSIVHGLVYLLVPMWMMRRAEDREPSTPEHSVRGLARGVVAYCVPLLGAQATFRSGQNLSKIVIGKLFTMTELGYFSLAYQLIERVVDLLQTLSAPLLPSFTQLVTLGQRQRLRSALDHALRLIQLAATALSFVVFVFAREIAVVAGSRMFEPSVPMLRILALVPMVRGTQQPLSMLFQAMRLPGTVLRLALIKFVTEFGSYLVLIPMFGVAGAAWANLAGAVVSCVAAMLLLAVRLPGGALARGRTGLVTLALFMPLIGIGLLIERTTSGPASLVLRLLLVPLGLVGVFALGLVNRYDLDKLSSVPLQAGWMRRIRDLVMGAALAFARALEPRRTL
jgi:O-antigen/teichoic acid export membrane protein